MSLNSLHLYFIKWVNDLIFTSSEITILKSFNDNVLKHVSFAANLCLLTVNEMHLIFEWREFRSEYHDFDMLRIKLSADVSLLSASAIVNAKTLKIVKDRCEFNSDVRIIKTALNRSEIYLQINKLQMSANDMLNLQHILSARVTSSFNIFKMIIFMNSIKLINNVCALMRV